MLHRSWCIRIAPALLSAVLLASPLLAAPGDAQRIERILEQTPLIDGHNDLPWEIRDRFGGDLTKIDLSQSTLALPAPAGSPPLMTDIPRLRAGHVGAQFWSVWIPVDTQGPAGRRVSPHLTRRDASGRCCRLTGRRLTRTSPAFLDENPEVAASSPGHHGTPDIGARRHAAVRDQGVLTSFTSKSITSFSVGSSSRRTSTGPTSGRQPLPFERTPNDGRVPSTAKR